MQRLARRWFLPWVDDRSSLLCCCLGRGTGAQADLREEAFDLPQAFADLGLVVGGEVVEGEGEECFHVCGCCLQVEIRFWV